jgi:hypothetical protein
MPQSKTSSNLSAMPKNSNENITFLQWNTRSISSNQLNFLQFIQENNFCVLALQSLNVHRSGLPHIPNYFFPPLCSYDKDFRIQSALYIRTDISYAFIAPEIMKNLDGVFSVSACIKVNDNINLNIMSVYLPHGPKENNTD